MKWFPPSVKVCILATTDDVFKIYLQGLVSLWLLIFRPVFFQQNKMALTYIEESTARIGQYEAQVWLQIAPLTCNNIILCKIWIPTWLPIIKLNNLCMNVTIDFLFLSPPPPSPLSWPSSTTWLPLTKWLSRISMRPTQRQNWTRSSTHTGHTSPLLTCNHAHLKPDSIKICILNGWCHVFLSYISMNNTEMAVAALFTWPGDLSTNTYILSRCINCRLPPGASIGPLLFQMGVHYLLHVLLKLKSMSNRQRRFNLYKNFYILLYPL